MTFSLGSCLHQAFHPCSRRIHIVFCVIAYIATLSVFPQEAQAQSIRNSAARAFAAKNYDKSIKLYRKIIRKRRRDYDSWTRLAASYYHTGLPRRALRYLKHSEDKTSLRSFNFFYQGLSYEALGMRAKAREFLKSAANFPDLFGGYAMFELGISDYQQRRKEKSRHWLNLYLQRYAGGKYRSIAIRVLQSIQTGRHLNNIRGMRRPDMGDALYKYNNLSLFSYPNFWFAQLGTDYALIEIKDKQNGETFKSRSTDQQALIANTGFGIGPIKRANGTAWVGYSYRQSWGTNSGRLIDYQEDFADFEYQPFRTDLLERHHQLYADLRTKLPLGLYAGIYGRIEFARIGTSLFSGPESQSIDPSVLKISDTTLSIPWLGISWGKNARTLAYLYLKKEINQETIEKSFQTYAFQSDSGQSLPLSLGLTHTVSFPTLALDLYIEAYQYEFIVNDYWLDYSKRGVNVSIQHQIFPRFYISALGGYYMDSYLQPFIRLNKCSDLEARPSTGEDLLPATSGSESLKSCVRDDTGILFKGSVFWNYSQFHRLAASLTFYDNKNPNQPEFDVNQISFSFIATMAFPSVKRVNRTIDRFADSTFVQTIQ